MLLISCSQSPADQAVPVPQIGHYLNNGFGWDTHALEPGEVSPSLSKTTSPEEQILKRTKGVATTLETLNHNGSPRVSQASHAWQFFPAQPLTFMPYLDSLYVFGNNSIEPGAVFQEDMLSTGAQRVKKSLSRVGVTYSLTHGFGYSGVVGPLHGNSGKRSFPAYNLTLESNITLLRNSSTGDGLFLATDLVYGPGLGFNQRRNNPGASIGAAQNPTGFYNNGEAYFENFSLGYAALKGKLLIMVGQIDMSNYMDTNSYSAPLDNGSLENNAALPLASCGWGYHIAWQPAKSFYMMLTSAANNSPARHNPFDYMSSGNWTNLLELGWITDDMAGLGPGTYRFQPFWVTSGGEDGGGVAINIQQQLGKNTTLGWFFRAGWADEKAARVTGVESTIATGLLWMSPFSKNSASRLFRSANNTSLGLGFVWQRGSESGGPYANRNEYGVELSCNMQVTPTMTIKPNIQYIHNPVYGRSGQNDLVFQIQNIWTW